MATNKGYPDQGVLHLSPAALHKASLPRLRRLLKLLDKGLSCYQIAKLPEWNLTPARIQQLRVKALRLREQEKDV